MDKKFNKAFSSVSLPYSHVDEPRFRQPIFGTNYLEGSIRPDTTAPFPLIKAGKFYLYFDGGCGNFLQGFFMYYARVRNNPGYMVNAHPMMDAPEARSAFVDPNDPTHVYLSQPEEIPAATPPSVPYAAPSGPTPSAPPLAPVAAAAAAATSRAENAATATQADNSTPAETPAQGENSAQGETPAEGAAPDPAAENRRLRRERGANIISEIFATGIPILF
ncbi:arabinogalactan [Babesia ovata]|uniref:Arabinogalactan n=1 Tax=Babesia ovata TaxID=189622 RepID=A0A2H6KA59_9APIC|nr:arabinogalactan [Babesia ovata]GBE59876.1 arabinogalactan [Babesia ovata]